MQGQFSYLGYDALVTLVTLRSAMSDTKFETYDMSRDDSLFISFLYKTFPGRLLLSIIIRPIFSKFFGFIMSSGISKPFISGFVKKNNIDLSEYKDVRYSSFNEFFWREIKEEFRPVCPNADDLVAPCDGKLSAYKITDDSVFEIKKSHYDITSLLADGQLAEDFSGGICLIFRLMPVDYHRYCYIDDCEVVSRKKIKGVLHTVRPIAMRRYRIFAQNSREYAVLKTKNLGKVVQMEVGALCVGKIINNDGENHFSRGQERGMFEFGASTVVMLFQKDAVLVDDVIFENTQHDMETVVRMGSRIGGVNF